MAIVKPWYGQPEGHGIATYTLLSWEHFAEFVDTEFLDYLQYIGRSPATVPAPHP